MNLLAQGEQWLADKQARFASELVTYARSEASVDVRATIGRAEFDVTDASGALLRVQMQDFIIATEDLALDGEPVEPRPGDRITKGITIFEVSSPGPGVDCWQWAENERIRRRIHAKQVGTTE
jgi:hypothetical protein